MASGLLGSIDVTCFIFKDKLLGGAFRDYGAVFQAYFARSLNQFLPVPGYLGSDNKRHFHLYRLPEPYLYVGGEAGDALGIGGIAHCLIKQAVQDTAVNDPGPPLMGFIGGKLGPAGMAIPGKNEFQSNGVILSAPEA
jgi:hypothetical protein